ncbi:MAG: hypothetical protein V2I46_02195 [Bacteroides sp.]|nr:hypothetical protein [Bacteroides sp.]
MKASLFIVSLLLFMFAGQSVFAQDNEEKPQVYRIETSDRNIYTGQIISETNEAIVLRTENLGDITLLKSNIIRRTRLEESGKENQIVNIHGNRYFVLSNSLGIPKGSGYYQNSWVFFNQAHYGITNNISIGAGIVPLFLFAGAPSPIWIVPSVNIPVSKDNFSLGVNALIATIAGEDVEGTAGFVTFTATFGNRNNNLSLGLGYGYAGENWAQSPLVSISGMIRTGQKHYLLTENYYVSGVDAFNLMSFFGGRFDFRGAALDYGLFIPMFEGMDVFVAVPWLGVAIPFGNH